MLNSRVAGYVLAAMLCLAAAAVEAKEVTLSHKGRTLNADLTLAAGKSLGDGVVLITHGTLAHRDMEIITSLRRLLNERGYNTLAINLGLGVDKRHGMYDCKIPQRHRNDDAPEEIAAWVDWLKGQGGRGVVVLGHSRGGAQTALYAAERDNPLVRAVVLLAPATGENNAAAAYQSRFNQTLAPILDKARKLVSEGKGATVLEKVGILSCSDASATAEAFVSYYDNDPRRDTAYLLPKIKKPTLVVVAGNDQIVVGLDKKIAPLVDGKRLRMTVVDSADHMFRDLYADDAVEAIDRFLKGNDQ